MNEFKVCGYFGEGILVGLRNLYFERFWFCIYNVIEIRYVNVIYLNYSI